MTPHCLLTLIPKRGRRQRPLLAALREVTPIQWALFLSGILAWTCDSIDFFCVSLSVTEFQRQFNRSTHDITTAITLTLLFRPIGSIIFGLLSDRFGRKWPLVINLIFIAVLQVGAGFVQTFQQLLAVRSLFGIGMGGVWGLSTATALENLPVEVRGIAGGFLQEGYAMGYLIAAVINLYLVPEVSVGWRGLFWTASGISFFSAFFRVILPESELFLRARAMEKTKGGLVSKQTAIFLRETKAMLRQHWLLCIYGMVFMSGFSFLAHGSQDLYPTYLMVSKGFSSHDATAATIIGNCGAIVGGVIAGWLSQYAGRRLTIILFISIIPGNKINYVTVLFASAYLLTNITVIAFIPLWILPKSFGPLSAGAFFLQLGVQGALGVIPIHLAELSPPAFRATFPGVSYQIGNLVTSASAQIEATGGEHLRTTIIHNGESTDVPDYASVQGIFIGVVAVFVIFMTVIGPENLGSHFERHRTAFEEVESEHNVISASESHLDKQNSEKGLGIDEIENVRKA